MKVVIAPEDPRCADAESLLDELTLCLTDITGDGGQSSFCIGDVLYDRALFVIARDENGEAVGCGAIRPIDHDAAEIKRMYARRRSKGVGTAILAYLEAQAIPLGYNTLRLETRLVNTTALSFYTRNGYRKIANYGKYAGNPAAVCFEKCLIPSAERNDV